MKNELIVKFDMNDLDTLERVPGFCYPHQYHSMLEKPEPREWGMLLIGDIKLRFHGYEGRRLKNDFK